MCNEYLFFMEQVSMDDVDSLTISEKSYGDSWKKRGGVGAFMMLARKWDRLENQLSKEGYDIFKEILKEGLDKKDGIIDDVRDLRRYLILVESHLIAVTSKDSNTQEDGTDITT